MDSEANRLGRIVPDVDGDRCVHGRSPAATCKACVSACPTGAFVLADDMLGIRESACDGCGLCRPACPERAIRQSFTPLLRSNRDDGFALFAHCERSGSAEAGRVSCIHALGRHNLEQLERRNLTFLTLYPGDCTACPRGAAVAAAGIAVERTVADYNAFRVAAGARPLEFRLVRSDVDWRRALVLFPQVAERVDPSRRRLLAAFRSGLDEARGEPASPRSPQADVIPRLFYHRPHIDAASCTGCDACLHVCPHGVLTLRRTGGSAAYVIAPATCTGCGLCRDVCTPKAVSLSGLGRQEQFTLPLAQGNCYKCGVPFHRPQSGAGTAHDLCRICAERDPTSKLYQVYE